jgi:hypothetical protein
MRTTQDPLTRNPAGGFPRLMTRDGLMTVPPEPPEPPRPTEPPLPPPEPPRPQPEPISRSRSR